MNSMEEVKYKYALNLKLSQLETPTKVSELLPHAEDLFFSSETFETIEEAVELSNIMVDELLVTLNESAKNKKYVMLLENNPALTGQETLTKDWEPMNLSKLWIVDEASQNTPGPIIAVGLVDLYQVHGVERLLN